MRIRKPSDGVRIRKSKTKHVGQSLTRLEDRPLLTGRGRFAADISFPQPIAYAHRALELRARQIARASTPRQRWRCRRARGMDGGRRRRHSADRFSLEPRSRAWSLTGNGCSPTDTVRYVGEPVAAVFAEDPYLAEDAAELVALDIEELPAILHADDAPGEFEPGRSTEPAIVRKGYGDVDAAFAAAHHDRRGHALDRAAFRRAAGNARRDRAL